MEEEDQEVQVSGYKITKTLGKGTFGKVRSAIHVATQQKVAVKILQKQLIKDPSDVERISRQIKILKKVYHPFIITMYEIVETQNRLYLFMEYANEGDLFGKICRQRKLKENVAATYYLQLLWGLKYLHQQGITHRDLKPENLLLENDMIKIADFGLGNFFEPNIQLKTACGSPSYASPEMISKLPYHPPKVDTWSSGIVLYAMVMGYLPFQDSNIHTLYTKIKKGEFRIPDWVSPPLKQLLKGILTVDPQKRMSIDDIISHPWIKFHNPNNQIVPLFKLDHQLILKVSTDFKLDKQKLNKALVSKKHNSLTTTYYLSLKKETRQSNQRNSILPSIESKQSQITTPTKQQQSNGKQSISATTTTNNDSSSKSEVKQSIQKQQQPITIQQTTPPPPIIQQSKVEIVHHKEEIMDSPKKVKPKEQKPILIQQQIKVEFQLTKKKLVDKAPLRKVGRMEIEGMKRTAQRLYERSGSRETEVSIRLTAAKKNKLLLKRIEKKPRLFNIGFFFQGHVQQLRDFVKKVEPKNTNINVQYYEVSPNILYLVKTNMQASHLSNELIQRLQ